MGVKPAKKKKQKGQRKTVHRVLRGGTIGAEGPNTRKRRGGGAR